MDDILTFTTPEHRWLSNMTYVDIEYDGVVYPFTENFYQAMKYHKHNMANLNFGDDNIFERFMVNDLCSKRLYISYLKPHEAKKFSKENKITSYFFEDKKLQILRYIYVVIPLNIFGCSFVLNYCLIRIYCPLDLFRTVILSLNSLS